MPPESTTAISLSVAVQRTGLSDDEVQRLIARRLVVEPLAEADLAEMRRIRRLQELGVNLAGIEIILHMRQRIIEQRADLARRGRAMPRREHPPVQDKWQMLLRWDPD